MLSCAVYGCTNNSASADSSVTYHPFPRDGLSDQWIQACGFQDDPIDLQTAHICSIHFEESAYDTELKVVDCTICYTKTLKHDAVPTLYLPETHIIIKENPIELENLKNVVVYTITSAKDTNGITTFALQEDDVDKQLFQVQPSTSSTTVKTNTPENPQQNHDSNKYDHIKSYLDLYVLQAHNKSLKRKIEIAEKEIAELEQTYSEKQSTCRAIEEECTQLETDITNQNIFTQQEQRTILLKVFSESQIKILFGKKKVSWSDDDMAVGYTIRHLSNKRCYTYLTKNLNIPLPAISSIKRWVTTKKAKKTEAKKKSREKTSSE